MKTCSPTIFPAHIFRVESRSLVTFKTKLFVTSVNNSFQLFLIFCHRELYLRCCIGLEYCDKRSWSTPMMECNLGKIEKTYSPTCPKNTFPEFFLH